MEIIDLEYWLSELKHSDKLILVEGKKDITALTNLGINETNIVSLSKKDLFNLAEDISKKHKEIILLTDLDKEGKLLYGKLKKLFDEMGVKVDLTFREWLQNNTKLSHIEGIDTYYEKN
ncbi:toprim domain-containing protein [Nanoarchaeota archaeon]